MLREFYEKVNANFPAIGNIIWKIYNKKIINKIHRKIRGKNNKIIHSRSILSSVFFDIEGDNNVIEIESGCILNNVKFYLRGNNHRIKIGKRCRFNRGGSIWFEDNNGSLTIGENSTFEDAHLAITEPFSEIRIGQDCMFAYGIDVRTGDSHSIISKSNRKRINYAKNVVIDNHVWVAAHCVILKGSFIPEDSVVATGSVVTQRYDKKGIIIGGNPARQLKEDITWSRERIYSNN